VRYFLSRIVQALVIVAGITIFVFFILRLTAGDPARIRGQIFSSNDVIAEYRRQFGTDRGVLEQLGTFLAGLTRGDLGDSFRFQVPVTEIVLPALRNTLLLGMTALALSLATAIVLGTLSARNPRGKVARVSAAIAVFGQSAPLFWVGLILIAVFSIRLGWFPSGGLTSWMSLVLPSVALALTILPAQMRVLAASVRAELHEDYVRTARAFGVPGWRVYFIHVLRNACLPLLTVVGNDMGMLLGGAIVAEVVFNYPGIGSLALTGLTSRDYPLIQGITIVAASTFVMVNLLVDLAYTVVNPRVRLRAVS
jgi:peptide/nickel transport system permease protein